MPLYPLSARMAQAINNLRDNGFVVAAPGEAQSKVNRNTYVYPADSNIMRFALDEHTASGLVQIYFYASPDSVQYIKVLVPFETLMVTLLQMDSLTLHDGALWDDGQ
jgi:hypothetical protein